MAGVVRTFSPEANPARRPTSRLTHLVWFVGGLVLFTIIPVVGTDVLALDANLYAAMFIWLALTFLATYVRWTNRDLIVLFRRRWRSSLFVGCLASIYLVSSVQQAPATTHPDGIRFIADLAWRGVLYGVANSLVLTAFPVAVARGLFQGHVRGLARRVSFAVVSLLLITCLSAAHYVGFPQLREHGIARPELAIATMSIPAVLTMNPVGSLVAQCVFQVTVTLHAYQSPLFVPPQIELVPQYRPPGVFGPY